MKRLLAGDVLRKLARVSKCVFSEWLFTNVEGSGYVAEHFRSFNFAFPQVLPLGLELGLVLGLGLGLGSGSGLGFSLGLVLYVLVFLALHYFL